MAKDAKENRGRVSLVGAGPGDPGLVTVRALERLREADLVLHDELVSVELLSWVPETAVTENVGKRGHEEPRYSQEEINERLVDAAREGLRVVRLKGGDPFIFGRGGEEASACVRAGVPYEIVPGVSSALAAPAYAGIPLTDRRHAASFAVVTGHKDPTVVSEATRWGALAQTVDTVVVLMGMRSLPEIVAKMLDGGTDPQIPSAVIADGSNRSQRVIEAPLRELPAAAAAAKVRAPAAIVIGDVVSLRSELEWFEPGRLAGVRVLVTRATAQYEEFARALRDEGAQPVSLPLVEMGPAADSAPLDAALDDLENFDGIVFASENAVRFTLKRAKERGQLEKLLAARLEMACVGATTAEAAQREGLVATCVGHGGGVDLVAELEKREALAGRRFLLPRSEIGSDDLAAALGERGAEVEAVVAYRNIRPVVDSQRLCEQIVANEFDVLTFASPSAVSHFGVLLDAPARGALSRVVVSALGATTAQALREEGIEPDGVPERPVLQAWIDALANSLGDRR